MSIFSHARLFYKKLSESGPNRKWFWVALIFSGGFILRYIFVFYFHPPENYIFSDMQGYFDRAYNIYSGLKEDIYSSFYPPGTHFIYSVFFHTVNAFLWIKWFNIILSSVTCLIIYMATSRLFGTKAGMFALLMSSFHYLFIDFTGYLLSETLYTFSLAAMFWFFLESVLSLQVWRRRFFAVLAGFTIIGSASFKSSILLFLPLFAIWWLFNFKKYRILYNLPFYALGFLPLFMMLVIRFYSLTGQFGIISSNGGFNFFQGRSHIKDLRCVDPARGTNYIFASPIAVQKGYDYNETFLAGPYDSDFFYSKGLDRIKKEPLKSAKYSLQHVADLFITADIWPSSAIDKPFPKLIHLFNTLSFIFLIIPAFFMGISKFKYLWSGAGLLTLFPIAVIIITSSAYYGDPRFRVPFDVFFIMLAAFFYGNMVQWLRRKKSINVLLM